MLHQLSAEVLTQSTIDRIGHSSDVLLQSGCLWAARKGHYGNQLVRAMLDRDCRIFVLQEWLEVNGIDTLMLMEGVRVIDYVGWVELTELNEQIVTWS